MSCAFHHLEVGGVVWGVGGYIGLESVTDLSAEEAKQAQGARDKESRKNAHTLRL